MILTVSIDNIDSLQSTLSKVSQALDVTEVLDEAEALLLNRIRDRFLHQVDSNNVPWKPSKRVIKVGGSTLFLSGTLFHSIQAFTKGPDYRSIGTDVSYGKYHQYGMGSNPTREFLGVNGEDANLIEKRILQRVMEALA